MSGRPEQDAMQRALLAWYDTSGREFEWRESDDPYAILVLEVMSQQTQLERVEQPWRAFIKRWPTVTALAEASTGDVIAFWSEHRLGYNRRAEYLSRAAEQIVEDWNGTVPSSTDDLQELHGVGPYTAHAVASFAFDGPHAVVDTNVRRVFSRACGQTDDIETIADAFLPTGKASEWNNALMDLGATVCTPTPRCDAEPCPWREWCDAYAAQSFEHDSATTQSQFRGSRRQYRGRIVRVLADTGPLEVEALGNRIHDSYGPDDEYDRSWLEALLADLESDGLVNVAEDESLVRLPE